MIKYYCSYWKRNIILDVFKGGFREIDSMTGEILLEWVNGKIVWKADR